MPKPKRSYTKLNALYAEYERTQAEKRAASRNSTLDSSSEGVLQQVTAKLQKLAELRASGDQPTITYGELWALQPQKK